MRLAPGEHDLPGKILVIARDSFLLVNNLVHSISLIPRLHRHIESARFAAYWSFGLHHIYCARLGQYRMSSIREPIDTYVHLCPTDYSLSEHHTTGASGYIIFTNEADAELLAHELDSLYG